MSLFLSLLVFALPPVQDGHAAHRAHGSTSPRPTRPDQPEAAPPPMDDHARHADHRPVGPVQGAAALPSDTTVRHAADLLFDPGVMAKARERLRRENGDVRTTAVMVDRLEVSGGDQTGLAWEAQGWSGGDIHRFWWKSDGKAAGRDGIEAAELQALYGRAIRPFWDVQVGVRQDYRLEDRDRTHAVVALQGLAPGFWEIDASGFISSDGLVTARLEMEYDQRITQRLILQPRAETSLTAWRPSRDGLDRGLSEVRLGLRLRYEIRREFAPYVGLEWRWAHDDARDRGQASGQPLDETVVLVGLRAWR